MKKYEPAITVVSLTLFFAVLAFLVTGAVKRQPDLSVPRMECKSIETAEPNEALVITQSGTDSALPTLDEYAHTEPNETVVIEWKEPNEVKQ